MKRIIWKELREGAVPAAGALAFFTLTLCFVWSSALTDNSYSQLSAHPLNAGIFQTVAMLGCGVLGALAGSYAIFKERSKDTWAFLVHRPLSTRRIFWAKTIAGLALYLGAALPPLIGAFLWSLQPDRVPTPFFPEMSLGLWVCAMNGMVCFFAGMLVGLRPVRWQGSRLMPLAGCFVVSVVTLAVPEFWQAMLISIVCAGALSLAAWGNFGPRGEFGVQPWASRAVTTLILYLGLMVVLTFLSSVVANTLPSSRRSVTSSGYSVNSVDKSGAILRVSYENGLFLQAVLTQPSPWTNSQPHTITSAEEYQRSVAYNTPLPLVEQFGTEQTSHYNRSDRFFTPLGLGRESWYYVPKLGRVVGYDARSYHLAGSVGPEGFTPGSIFGSGSFKEPLMHSFAYYRGGTPATYFATRAETYGLDLDQRTVSKIYTPPAGEAIESVGVDQTLPDQPRLYCILTGKRLVALTAKDEQVFNLTLPPRPFYSDQVSLTLLGDSGHVILMFPPSYIRYRQKAQDMPILTCWFDKTQGLLKTALLPAMKSNRPEDSSGTYLAALFGSPVANVLLHLQSEAQVPKWIHLFGWLLGCISASVALAICRRYRITGLGRLGWIGFTFATGLVGLLAMSAAREWPLRVPCPTCGRKRMVTRKDCEHCASAFPPARERWHRDFRAGSVIR